MDGSNWQKMAAKVRACTVFGGPEGAVIAEELESFAKEFVNCFLPQADRDRDAVNDPEVKANEDDTEVKNMVAGKWMDAVEDYLDELKHCSFDDDAAKACAMLCKGGYAKCGRCQDKRRTLQKLHVYWALITPGMLPEIVDTLGASSTRFMRCLSVQITPKMIQTYPMFNRLAMRRLQYSGRGLRFGTGEWDDVTMTENSRRGGLPAVRGVHVRGPSSYREPLSDEDEEEKMEEQLWEKLAPKNPSKEIWEFTSPTKVEVLFQWCGVSHLLSDDDHNFAIVGALSAQAVDAGVFSPVVSQVILDQNWRHGQIFFGLEQLLHFTAIVSMLIMVWRQKDGHSGSDAVQDSLILKHFQSLPRWLEIGIVMAINYWCLIMHSCLELAMAFIEFQPVRAKAPRDPRTWFGPYLTMWAMGMIFIEIVVCFNITGVLHDYRTTPEGQNYLARHPVYFAIVISLKWFQFLIGMLATKYFGTTVLPAFYAMKSKESVCFLIYMFMALLCMTHAYYSFPLAADDYEADPSMSMGMFLISFVRMFRLCILGDFDLWELEGIDPVFNFTERFENNGNVALDEPSDAYQGGGEKAVIHNDFRMVFMVVVLVTAVMMMNMYIGVLGKEYERFANRKVEMFAHQRAKVLVRFLLRRRFWVGLRQLVCPCSPGRFGDSDDEESDDSDDNLEDGELSTGSVWKKLHRKQQKLLMEDALSEGNPDNHSKSRGSVLKTKGFWMAIPPESVTGASLEDRVQDIDGRQQDMHKDVHMIKSLLKDVMKKNRELQRGRR